MIRTIDGMTVLDIFENFQTDRGLKKFTNDPSNLATSNIADNSILISNMTVVNSSSMPNTGFVSWGPSAEMVTNTRRPITERFESWMSKLRNWVDEKKRVTPEKVFAEIVAGQTELASDLEKRLTAIDVLKDSAKKNGQTALYEQILRDERRLRSESVLATAGFRMFISEEMMVSFARKCEHGLRLDWIKNFTRVIPNEVIEQKQKADELKIFDNYVVLHYDPNGKSTALTEEEVRKKRDPILFGVFSQSRRLYFIGDWKDEFCDLTLEELLGRLGRDNQIDSNQIVLP